MLPVFLILVMTVVKGAAAPLATSHWERAEDIRARAIAAQHAELAQLMTDFFERTGTVPDTLTEITDLLPYALTAPQRLNYAVARDLRDGTWRYDRAVLYVLPNTVTPATFLASNACGAQDFTVAPSWCPQGATLALRIETRDNAAARLAAAHKSIADILRNFAHIYYRDAAFPNALPGGGTIAANATVNAVDLFTGVANDALACTGTPDYQGKTFGCDQIFPPAFGVQFIYHFVHADHVGVLLETPLRRDDGTTVVIGEHIEVI